MKRYFILLIAAGFIFVLSSISYAAISIDYRKTNSSGGIAVYDLSVSVEGSSNKKKVSIINDGLAYPKKVIWLFHGYKPEGDPYSQSPRIFIEKWHLVKLCRENDYICVAPDMGTSLYSVAGLANDEKITDMRWLKEAYNRIIFRKFKDLPAVLVGVSTGVEGAIKFSPLIQNVESIVALSGTYDFFALSENSGEYRIHKYAFGTDINVWRAENPVEMLKHLVRIRLFLLCESGSIYKQQADIVKDLRLANIDVVDLLPLGKGYSHNWNFWGNKAVVKNLHEIITREGKR
jgi:hypothetical protein